MTLFFREFLCQAEKTFKFSNVFRVRSRNPKTRFATKIMKYTGGILLLVTSRVVNWLFLFKIFSYLGA